VGRSGIVRPGFGQMAIESVEKNFRSGIDGRLALVSLVYALAGAIFSWDAYIALLRQYSASYFYALPPMLLGGLAVAAVVANPRAPVAWLKHILRERALGASLTIAIFCLGIASFSTFKHHIPAWLPFFADEPLAALDEWLHFDDPWRWAHAMAPDGSSSFLSLLYGPGWFVEWLGMVLVAAFITDNRLRIRYFVAFAATILLLGTLLRAAGASAGPIFYDRMFGGERFADLVAVLAADPFGARMIGASDYLYSAYLSDDAVFGTGISAMPSIHVAMAVLNALLLTELKRWLGIVGWLFAAGIMFGSVFFGWHYALDGYVSTVLVLVIWWWAGRVVDAPARPV